MAGASKQVRLQFMADTSQPQQQLQQLATQLKQISGLQFETTGINKGVQEAVKSAETLQKVLQKAVSVDTGKLNMNAFTAELNKTGMNISQLSAGLLQLGPAGAQAFRTLASSVAQAEMPIRKMNATLSGMLTSLANTVKWQLSSSAIHGLMSGFSSAVGYVKDLNSSLNDIRIVTGKSIDDMARFAEQANKAAKALSTTTKAYTDASLIYYQQGDSQEMAAKKAAITIKAANASFGSSTKEMSEYLTAVWNSYQVGADELERYVDIMAALGAKTATSLEEIATSMQKVAATANTVGVSMEQVSSIISTVSSVTRESAESIGTSYKTIFARISDLKLGEVIDGVSLGQVSSQLKSIGVNVLDASGNLRDMGDIINDLGTKWQTMGAAQKAATAQVVAGKRQYTQLMALFENWDMYKKNISIAENANGELQNMSDTYAQSWEAASAKVRASWEGVWKEIFNDEQIISFMNSFADFITGIEDAIKGLGGLQGVLLTLGNVAVTVFQKNIATNIDGMLSKLSNFKHSFDNMSVKDAWKSFFTESTFTRQQKNYYNEMQTASVQYMHQGRAANNNFGYTAEGIQTRQTEQLIAAKQRLLDIGSKLSDKDQIIAKDAIANLEKQILKTNALTVERKESLDALNMARTTIVNGFDASAANQRYQVLTNQQVMKEYMSENDGSAFYGVNANISSFMSHYRNLALNADVTNEAMQRINLTLKEYKAELESTGPSTDRYENAIREIDTAIDALVSGQADGLIKGIDGDIAEIQRLRDELKTLPKGTDEYKTALNNLSKKVTSVATTSAAKASGARNELQGTLGINTGQLTEMENGVTRTTSALFGLSAQSQKTEKDVNNCGKAMSKLGKQSPGQIVAKMTSALMSFSSALTTTSSLIENWGEQTTTSVVSSFTSLVASLAMAFSVGGPWGLAIAAVGAVLGIVLGTAERQTKEFQEKQKKALEESTKAREKDQEELDNTKTLIKEYNELYETYRTTGEGQEQLAETAYKLAEAYGILGANVLIAQGNFQGFQQELIRALRLDTQIETIKGSMASNLHDFGVNSADSIYRIAYNTGQDSTENRKAVVTQVYREVTQDFVASLTDMTPSEGTIDVTPWTDKFTVTFGDVESFLGDDGFKEVLVDVFKGDVELARQYAIAMYNDAAPGDFRLSDTAVWEDIAAAYTNDWFQTDDFNSDEVFGNSVIASARSKFYDETLLEKGLDAWLTSLGHTNLVYDDTGFFDNNGNLMWNTLSGEEKYFRYSQLQAEITEIDKILGEIDQMDEGTQKELAGYRAYLVATRDSYKTVVDNENIRTMVKSLSSGYALLQDLRFQSEHLANFLGQGEDNTTFKEYSNSMILMEDAITEAMKKDKTAYESLSEFMLDDGKGGFIVDPSRINEYNLARQKLISQMMDDYTSFDDYTRIYESIIASFSSVSIQGVGKSEAELVKAYIQDKGIKTIKEFSAELINALNYLFDQGIYTGLADNQLLNTIMLANQKQTVVDETHQKATTLQSQGESLSENMSYQEAENLVEAIDWGQNGIIALEEFVKMDYEERQAYIQSIADTYANTTRNEADQLLILRKNSLDVWKATINDNKAFNGLYGSSNGFTYGNATDDWNASFIMNQYAAWRVAQGYVENGAGGYTKDTDTFTEDDLWQLFLTTTQGTEESYASRGFNYSYNTIASFISAIGGAGTAQAGVDSAQLMIDTFSLLDNTVESTATQIERLSKALSQLPTNTKDLQKIADALYGGNVRDLVGSTIAERAEAMVTWLSKNKPTLTTTKVKNFKDYAQYTTWATSKNLSPISQKDFEAGKFTLPDGTTWEQIEQDLGEGTQLVETEVQNWGQYLADIASYDKAMGAVLAIKNQGAKDDLDQLQALESGFKDFVESGVMSDETKNALELLGIDPNTINDVDDYVTAINNVSAARATYANTLKTNLQTYDDNLGFNIDWTKMDAGLSYEEFIAQQTQLTEAQRNSLLLMTNLSQAYEQWRQADVEADDVGVDTEAIKARDAMNKSIAASTQNIEKLEQAATKAKAAVDALNGALGNSQPLSFEAIEQLKQAGITATNWGNGTGVGALGIYGTALGKSAMAEIEALIAKQANYALAQSTIKTNDDIYHFSPTDRAELGLPEPTEIDKRKTFDFDLMSLTNADERDKLIQSMGFNGAAIQQINAMIEAAKESESSLTWSDIFTNLSKYNGELDGAMGLIWAQFKDDGVEAVQAILQAEQAAAQKTVDVWRNAFSAIIAAKQGMAEGKTLGESLAGDEGQLAVVLATAHQLGIDPVALLSGNGGANWANITSHANFQFNPAKYAESLGGATQFLYGPDGVIAANYHDMYGHASTRFHADIDTYWAQATAGKSEAELLEMGLTATSKEEMIAQLLKYYFPDGYWSATEQEYHDAIGAVQAPEYASKIKQARADFDAATTLYNKDYETRMARIGVYKEIETAVAQSMLAENKGKSVSDIIGAERMAELEAQYGITADQVNSSGVQSWISSGISTEMAAINESYATYLATVEEIDNLDLIGTVDSLTEDATKQLDAMNLLYGDGSTRRYEAMTNIIKNLAEAYGMSEEGMRRYIIAADKANGGSGQITADTLKLANAMLAQQAAVDAATESLDDYILTIKKGDKTSIEYQNSLDGIRKIVGGLLGLDANATQGLSETLLADTEFLALLQKIINGEATDADWTAFKTKYTNDTASTNKNDVSGTKLTADTTKGKDATFKEKIAKIQHEAQLLEQEMEALNSIDITEMPVAGTAAYNALSEALNKAGKSMAEYSKMSSKERAQALGDAKVAKLREQKDKNAELIEAYETHYNFEDDGYGWDNAVAEGYTTQYQAYLDAKERELKLNQEIADTRQDTQEKIYEIGAADADARIAALEAERTKVQEVISDYTELANILMSAAKTGELTAETILKMNRLDKTLLSSWKNANTYAERVTIAAKVQMRAMNKELAAEQESLDGIREAQRIIKAKGSNSTSKYQNTSFADEKAFKTTMSSLLSQEGLDAVMQAWKNVNAKMTSESTLTDFYRELNAELANMEANGVEGMEELKAAARKTISDMYQDLGEYEVSMAKSVVETWLDAFKQIADARKKLIMGEDIGDSLTSSLENYITLAKAFSGNGSLANAFKSGSLTANQLNLGAAGELSEALLDSMGLSTKGPGFNLFNSVNGRFANVYGRAKAFGMSMSDYTDDAGNFDQNAFNEAVNKRTEAYLLNLLRNSGMDSTTANDYVQQALYGTGKTKQDAVDVIDAAAAAIRGYTQEYAGLLESNQQLSEVDAMYQARVKELTEQQDKAKLGVSATDAIQETAAGQRTAETVAAALQQAGISPESYIQMLQDKGYQVTSLEDIANLSDTQLEAIETSLEQDAIAAGNAIIQAAQIFNAIVTSGGDEAVLKTKLDALGAVRDENGNIVGFEEYRGGGLGYGADTAAGKQAAQAVTDATEAGNTLTNQYGVNQTEDLEAIVSRAATKAGMSLEELKEYSKYLQEIGEINGENEHQNLLLAASYARIQKGLKSVQDNLKTYTKTLKEAQKGTVDHQKALNQMREVYGDVLDLDDKGMKALSEDFMTQEDVLKDLEDAAKGVEGAYDRLQEKATKNILDNLTGDADISSMSDEIAALSTAINQLPEGQALDWNELLGAGAIGQAVAGNLSSLASFVNGLASSASEASNIMQALAAALGMDMEIEQKQFNVKQYRWEASAGGAVGYGVDGAQVYVPLNVEAIPVEGTVSGWSIKTITNKGSYGGGIKSSSGNGGGGGGKPKKVDRKKAPDEKDRYYEVNQRLERMTQLLDKVAKYKDRAFGATYLKNLEKELSLMESQEAMYKRKLDEAKQWLEYDKQRLAEYGATYDEFGNINNYDEIWANEVAKYNAVVDQYNAMTAEQQKQADEDELLKKAEERLSNWKDYYADYAESVSTIYEMENELEAKINEKSAKYLEGITYKAEYQIELNDGDRELLQFFVDRYDDDANKQAEVLENLIAQGTELAKNTEILKQKQQELEAAYAAGKITQADYAEGLKATKEELLENAQALLELEQKIKDFYKNALEKINEEFSKHVDHITAATEAMQSYINILGLMGKGQNVVEKQLFYSQAAEFAQQEAIAKKSHLDLLLAQKEEFEALGENMTDVQKQWYEDLLTAIDEATSEYLSSVEAALQALEEKYLNSVAVISEKLEKELSGSYGSLEALSDAYSYYTETQGRYVSAARELYEVSKLNRDIEMSIEDATTSASKKMLKDLKDRINAQSELNQLTEYDIEMNRLQYELALAKIGLEEAQNAKDTVRLTRDESGNYIYQYTADNDKINEAQQTYEDVLQQINDLALNRMTELEQGFVEARMAYKEQYDAIVNDMNLTDEQRAEKLAILNERFKNDMDYYAEQMGIAAENLTTSNATIMQVYSEDLRNVSMTTRDGINEDIAALVANKDEAIESFQTAVTDAQKISEEHQKSINAFTSQTVGDYNTMKQAAENYGKAVEDAMGKAEDAVGPATDAMMDDIISLGKVWENFIDGPLEKFIDGIIDLAEEIQNTLDWLAELEGATATTPDIQPEDTKPVNPEPEKSTDDQNGGSGGTGGSGGEQEKTYYYKVNYNGSNLSTEYSTKAKAQAKIDSEISYWNQSYMGAYQSHQYDLANQYKATWDKWKSATISTFWRYEMGGLADFTGPAWLDGTKSRPELVLNATDTQNMLSAIGTLRELDTDSIALLVSALNAATNSIFSVMGGALSAAGMTNNHSQSINQNVEIHADFPNVTDKNEIIDALDDLVNRAAQYSQKKMW